MTRILHILTMFGPLSAAKFWVAAIMGVVQFVQIYFGIDVGLDQEIVSGLIAGLTALFVWIVPNKRKKQEAVPMNDPDYFPPKPGLY